MPNLYVNREELRVLQDLLYIESKADRENLTIAISEGNTQATIDKWKNTIILEEKLLKKVTDKLDDIAVEFSKAMVKKD